MTRRLIPRALLIVAALTAACSSDSSPTSPTGSRTSRGAVISGRVTGASSRAAATDVSTTMATSRLTVSVVGTDISTVVEGVSNLSGTCPALTFTVRATTVRTNGVTRFTDGPCSRIANGVRLEVEGRRQPDGAILATEVEFDD